jgi:hypothetical protein
MPSFLFRLIQLSFVGGCCQVMLGGSLMLAHRLLTALRSRSSLMIKPEARCASPAASCATEPSCVCLRSERSPQCVAGTVRALLCLTMSGCSRLC